MIRASTGNKVRSTQMSVSLQETLSNLIPQSIFCFKSTLRIFVCLFAYFFRKAKICPFKLWFFFFFHFNENYKIKRITKALVTSKHCLHYYSSYQSTELSFAELVTGNDSGGFSDGFSPVIVFFQITGRHCNFRCKLGCCRRQSPRNK